MAFIDKIFNLAKSDVQTIVLPESNDVRVVEAAQKIMEMGIAKIIMIGDENAVKSANPTVNLCGVEFVNPTTFRDFDKLAEGLYELRKAKGMTLDEAKSLLKENPLFMGCMLVKLGYAGGMVAGAANSTANVLRPALQIIKTAPNTKLVSAIFILAVPNCEYGADGVFVFGDCALNPNPNAEELAQIAISSAETFKCMINVEPVVAMLSFSSKGSASHADVDKVREATELAKKLEPSLMLDGELQLDASIVPSVGKKKAPGSDVAGNANVLIFPDLDAANIGYKLVQRFGKAEAYGPLCQGLAMPVNDLSRGCYVDDIVGTVAFTALQAQLQAQCNKPKGKYNYPSQNPLKTKKCGSMEYGLK